MRFIALAVVAVVLAGCGSEGSSSSDDSVTSTTLPTAPSASTTAVIAATSLPTTTSPPAPTGPSGLTGSAAVASEFVRRALVGENIDDLVATILFTGPDGSTAPAPELVDQVREAARFLRLVPRVLSFEPFVTPDVPAQGLGAGCRFIGDFHRTCRVVLHTGYEDFYVGVGGISQDTQGSSAQLAIEGSGLDPASLATLFVRRAALAAPVVDLAADFTWGPPKNTYPYVDKVVDPQLPSRLQAAAAGLAGTVSSISPHPHSDDVPLTGTDVRGCRGNPGRELQCSLDVARTNGSTTLATVTLVRDASGPYLVGGFTMN
jgi:hypothetical protein